MFIDREKREELNKLSKEVFGVAGRWQKILEHGTRELITETMTETVPGDNGKPDETREVKIAVKMNGTNKYKNKYYTIDEVHELLLKFKKNRDDQIARMKAAQEKRELDKKVNDLAQGRVVG